MKRLAGKTSARGPKHRSARRKSSPEPQFPWALGTGNRAPRFVHHPPPPPPPEPPPLDPPPLDPLGELDIALAAVELNELMWLVKLPVLNEW